MPKYVSTHRGFDIYRFEANESPYNMISYTCARAGEQPKSYNRPKPFTFANSEEYLKKVIDEYLDAESGQQKELDKAENDRKAAEWLAETEAAKARQNEIDEANRLRESTALADLREKERLEVLAEKERLAAEEEKVSEPLPVDPRPEPIKPPTEKESFINSFIFNLKAEWSKLMEMLQ